jgi:hypothetical protein
MQPRIPCLGLTLGHSEITHMSPVIQRAISNSILHSCTSCSHPNSPPKHPLSHPFLSGIGQWLSSGLLWKTIAMFPWPIPSWDNPSLHSTSETAILLFQGHFLSYLCVFVPASLVHLSPCLHSRGCWTPFLMLPLPGHNWSLPFLSSCL